MRTQTACEGLEMARAKKVTQREWKEPVDLLDELGLVGEAPAWIAAAEMVCTISHWANTPVLLLGPSGSGKEGFAKLAHAASERKGPFVAVNCNTLSPSTAQADLFGYEKGAFTGATKMKKGLIEEANGGTIFLDEGGDLNIDIQGMLLGFLQERRIIRFGGTKEIPVDVQVVFATWRDLPRMSEDGSFRHDLLNRLSISPVKIPPLVERLDDIPLLVELFCSQDEMLKDAGLTLNREAMEELKRHTWPGNIRDLQSVLKRLVFSNIGKLHTSEPWEAGGEDVEKVLALERGEAENKTPPPSIIREHPETDKSAKDDPSVLAHRVISAMAEQGAHTAAGWVPRFSEAGLGALVTGTTPRARSTRAGMLLRKLESSKVDIDGRIFQLRRTYQWTIHKRPLYVVDEVR